MPWYTNEWQNQQRRKIACYEKAATKTKEKCLWNKIERRTLYNNRNKTYTKKIGKYKEIETMALSNSLEAPEKYGQLFHKNTSIFYQQSIANLVTKELNKKLLCYLKYDRREGQFDRCSWSLFHKKNNLDHLSILISFLEYSIDIIIYIFTCGGWKNQEHRTIELYKKRRKQCYTASFCFF